MKENIIGREREQQILEERLSSGRAEFIAVYGRRRVGKTFLIKEYFEKEMVFQTAGMAKAGKAMQLKSFYSDLMYYGLPAGTPRPQDWIEAFSLLRRLIESHPNPRKVVLLDELPWMDTPKSGFIQALEHFWNSWASSKRDLVLVVCGSATSWMMNKLINSHGGLYNRITCRLMIEAFTLRETEKLLLSKGFHLSRYEIAEYYMIMGGTPFYLDMLSPAMSLAQNIDTLLFSPTGSLHDEFRNLYAALFKNSDDHEKVVEALSRKGVGLTREELLKASGLPSGGAFTTILQNLKWCGFIREYTNYHHSRGEQTLYQLVDFFTLFHYNFLVDKQSKADNTWTAIQVKPRFATWMGLTFELLALSHVNQIKQKLGIRGINTQEYAWRCPPAPSGEKGAQVDLVIVRDDRTVNLCEIKCSMTPYYITESEEMSLRNKVARFMEADQRKHSVQLTFVSTFGVERGSHSGIVNNEITLQDLFE